MTDIQQAKTMARALRDALAARSMTVTHSEALELVARSLGHADWNTFSALAERPGAGAADAVLNDAIPIFRSFDEAKAKAFYLDLLGFKLDWEHRFGPEFPLFFQVSRDGLRLHVSEHHRDATPGSAAYIYVSGLDALGAELRGRGSGAEIEPGPSPNMRVLVVWDPSGNRLRFAEIAPSPVGVLPEGYSAPAI